MDFSDLYYSLMILADKNANNDLPPPRLYRKCIQSTLKLCKTLRKKNRGKNQHKGKKIQIGVEYIPLERGMEA